MTVNKRNYFTYTQWNTTLPYEKIKSYFAAMWMDLESVVLSEAS